MRWVLRHVEQVRGRAGKVHVIANVGCVVVELAGNGGAHLRQERGVVEREPLCVAPVLGADAVAHRAQRVERLARAALVVAGAGRGSSRAARVLGEGTCLPGHVRAVQERRGGVTLHTSVTVDRRLGQPGELSPGENGSLF